MNSLFVVYMHFAHAGVRREIDGTRAWGARGDPWAAMVLLLPVGLLCRDPNRRIVYVQTRWEG